MAAAFAVASGCGGDAPASAESSPGAPAAEGAPQMTAAPTYTYRVVNRFPHDSSAFTQGLVVHDGVLYESTGLYGESTLRKVALETGEVLARHDVAARYFAEGLTAWQDQLIQLTWEAQVGFIYNRETFEVLRTFQYTGEGWGLTHDGTRLILSDGSEHLRFLDPETFEETGRVTVRDRGAVVSQLNELEFVRGEIFANVWQTDRIARISPETGVVIGWIDLAGLQPAAQLTSIDAVLNGIAYDAGRDRLFVTGKLWPTLFEITLERR
jgi:glutamine cyclotransferase